MRGPSRKPPRRRASRTTDARSVWGRHPRPRRSEEQGPDEGSSGLNMPNIDLSTLSAAELDLLIATAAKLRQSLQPAVTLEPPQTSEATIDPAWRCLMHGANTVLQLRHLGVGWVTVIIPPHERAGLLAIFMRQALTPAIVQASPVDPPASPTLISSGGNTVH
jgi:hypothetical protein